MSKPKKMIQKLVWVSGVFPDPPRTEMRWVEVEEEEQPKPKEFFPNPTRWVQDRTKEY